MLEIDFLFLSNSCQIDFFIPFNEQFKIAFKLDLLLVREFNLLLF